MTAKICTRCDQSLPLSEFHKKQSSPDGLRPDCKSCRKPLSHDYYRENLTIISVKNRERASRNKFKYREVRQKWREENRDSLLASKKAYYQENHERCLEAMKRRRELNPMVNRLGHPNRRAKRYAAAGRFTAQQAVEKVDYFGGRCYLCKKELAFDTMQLDHRIPFSRGGTNWIANIAPACQPCNRAKGARTEKEFRAIVPFS